MDLWFKVYSEVSKVVELRKEVANLQAQLSRMDVNKQSSQARQLTDRLEETRNEMHGLQNEISSTCAKIGGDMKNKIYQASQVVNNLSAEIIKQKEIIRNTKDDVEMLTQKYKAMGKTEAIGSHVESQLGRAKAALGEQRFALGELQTQQAKARLNVKQLNDEFKTFGKDSSDSVGSIVDQLKGMAAISLAGIGIKDFLGQVIQVRGEFENIETSLGVLLNGDQQKLKQLMGSIQQYALISPLTTKDMTGALQMMMGFGLKADDSVTYLKALGDISMGDTVKFNSLSLAFSQMSAAGKLMGQDLNQMINAGFNPLSIIAEKTGKSVGQLKEEMSKGVISSKMVQQAFIDATSEGGKFFGMAKAGAKTLNGQISMLQESYDLALNKMGKDNEGMMISGIQSATYLVSHFQDVAEVLKVLVEMYGIYKAAVITNIALEKIQAMSRLASVNGTSVLSAATGILTGRIAILNTIMSLNPYVALAAGLAALCVVMYEVTDHTTALEKEQRNADSTMERMNKSLDGQKNLVEELSGKIQDENVSNSEKESILKRLKSAIPSVYGKYDHFIDLQNDLANATRSANLQLSEQKMLLGEKTYSSNQQDINLLKTYRTLLGKEKTKGLSSSEKNQKDVIGNYVKSYYSKQLGKAWSLKDLDELISAKIQVQNTTYASGARKSVMDKYSARISTGDKKTMESYDKWLTGLLEKALKSGKKYASIGGIPVTIDQVKNLRSQVRDRSTYLNRGKKNYSGDAKTELSNAENELSRAKRGKYTDENEQANAIKQAEDNVKKAKERYKMLGGSETEDKKTGKSSSATRHEKEIAAENKATDNLAKIKQNNAEKIGNLETQLKSEIGTRTLDAEQSTFEQQQKQREANNRKELEDIDKKRREYIKTVVEASRSEFEADRSNKGKKWTGSTQETDAVSRAGASADILFGGLEDATISRQLAQQEKAYGDRIKAARVAWNNYYKEFGNMQQKRVAIEAEYQQKIQDIRDNPKMSSDEKDANIMTLEKQQANALDDFDKNVQTSTTLMAQLFQDTATLSSSAMDAVIKKVELLLKYLMAAKDAEGNANIEGKTYTPSDILSLGISKNTLDNLQKDPTNIKSLREGLTKYKSSLAGKNLGKSITEDFKNAWKKTDENGNKRSLSDKIIDTGAAIQKYTPYIKEFGKNLGTIFGNDKLGDTVSKVTEGIDGIGEASAGVAKILSGDVLGGIMSVASGAAKVVNSVEGLFGADYTQYNDMVEKYNKLISVWDTLIDRKKEYLSESYGEDTVKTEKEILDLYKQEEQAKRNLGKERLNSGASAGSHSIGRRMWENLTSGSEQDLIKLYGSGYMNKLGSSRMTGLFDMSVEELKKLQKGATEFWSTMDEDVRTYLEDIIKAGDEATDSIKDMQEKIAGMTFDSFFDSFIEGVTDMGKSFSDLTDGMKEDLKKSILNTTIGASFQKDIQSLYDKWSKTSVEETSDGGTKITKSEYQDLMSQYTTLTYAAREEVKSLYDTFGWSYNDATEASKATTVNASQDSVDEANGRMTAIEELEVERNDKMDGMGAKMDLQLEHISEIQGIADETRDFIVNSYLVQTDIRDNTDKMVKQLDNIKSDISSIKDKTKNL